MILKDRFWILLGVVCGFATVRGRGLLLLYRPRDVSADCAVSRILRYDLSFGGGMSDTITLVLRTMSEIDYGCTLEIVTEKDSYPPFVRLIVVLRFPIQLGIVCEYNPEAFVIIKGSNCVFLCELINRQDKLKHYFSIQSLTRFRLQFYSNSSINADIHAPLYEVTATSARRITSNQTCQANNETECILDETKHEKLCLTSGVVCDGIKNCGVDDWFDERKSECELPVQKLGITPIASIITIMACCIIVFAHLLRQCLSPVASTFFIFNTNEDNRLCIDPLFIHPDELPSDNKPDYNRRKSLIPVDLSSSETDTDPDEPKPIPSQVLSLDSSTLDASALTITKETSDAVKGSRAAVNMLGRIQRRLRSVAGRAYTPRASSVNPNITFDIVEKF